MKITYENNQLILPEINCQCGIEHQQPDLDVYIVKEYLRITTTENGSRECLGGGGSEYYRAAGAETMRLLAAGIDGDALSVERRKNWSR